MGCSRSLKLISNYSTPTRQHKNVSNQRSNKKRMLRSQLLCSLAHVVGQQIQSLSQDESRTEVWQDVITLLSFLLYHPMFPLESGSGHAAIFAYFCKSIQSLQILSLSSALSFVHCYRDTCMFDGSNWRNQIIQTNEDHTNVTFFQLR